MKDGWRLLEHWLSGSSLPKYSEMRHPRAQISVMS